MNRLRPQYRRVIEGTTRNINNDVYHFKAVGEIYLVCKKFFIDTLKVGEKMIRNIIKNTTDGIVKHTNQPTVEFTLNINMFKNIFILYHELSLITCANKQVENMLVVEKQQQIYTEIM